MIFRVSALARARGATFARRCASTEVSTQKSSSGGLNAFVAGWYNLYVVYVDRPYCALTSVIGDHDHARIDEIPICSHLVLFYFFS
jgi:hypothetical protein